MQAHGDDHAHLLHHADGQLFIPRGWEHKRFAVQHARRAAVDLQIARRLQRDKDRRQAVLRVDGVRRICDRLQMLLHLLPRTQDEHGVLPLRAEIIAQEIAVHGAAARRL